MSHTSPLPRQGGGLEWGRLHRGQDSASSHLGRQELMPIGLAWDHAFSGPLCIVRGLDTTRCTTCLDGLDRLDEQAARLNDGLVGRPEVLFGAVYNAPHAFLPGPVLRIDALDTRKIDRFLHLPIDEVVVFPAPLGTEGSLIDIQRTIAQTEFKTVFLVH